MESKSYYKIKDIAEIIEETPSTLRYWETEFRQLSPKRGEKGRRLYSQKDLETLRKIKFLIRDKGMHISAAKEQLNKNNKNISTRAYAIAELESVRDELKVLLDSLKKVKI